ncbi:hypothetical protein RJ641_003292 [Dillenia turbinata]|uniref:Retrovirus-related Pol polyprotein from transposon TNT 1-94-like beta-barrel domain-containing protein n=1 Tax=Dillenia turbinata TaxID=194707 RepID=A0AAN8Z9A2_9MAGN
MARTLWEELENKYAAQNLDAFNKMILEATATRIILVDEDKALILILSLPSSWEHFTDTMLYGRDTIALSIVKNALLQKDMERMSVGTSVESHGASLVMRGKLTEKGSSSKSKGKSKDKVNHKNLKCFYYHQPRHIRKNCPERRDKQVANVATEVSIDVDQVVDSKGEVYAVTSRISKDDWILDTATSFHMTPHRHCFSTYKEKEGKVEVGDNRTIERCCEGNIQLKSDLGVVTEFRAWHVPELGEIK